MCNVITANAAKDRFSCITTGVPFASVVESHRVKIGKVQSARRRHWRDAKEKEGGVEGEEEAAALSRMRRAGKRYECMKKRGREKPRGKYCFRGSERLRSILRDAATRAERIYCARGVKSCIAAVYDLICASAATVRLVVPHTGYIRYCAPVNFNRAR